MSSQALELREQPQATALTSAQLQFISATQFVPAGLRGNMPAILACVATGRELGLGDMTALRSIHIIDGKATFSAELMVQLVRKRGHSITGSTSADGATAKGKRIDNGDEMTAEFTIAMAERIGLDKKDVWKKYPEAMLWARAVSALCRMLFADCFAGASYTPEELGAGDITADELQAGEIVEPPIAELVAELLELAGQLGVREAVDAALLEDGHGDDRDWLVEQIGNARQELEDRAPTSQT